MTESTIQFNSADPMHEQVINLLNQHGRRKAQFIVNAIIHYINCSETINTQSINKEMIETIVRSIINENQISTPLKNDKNIGSHETQEIISEDELVSIANTMAMFRGS